MLKFKEVEPDQDAAFLYEMRSECNQVTIGVYPVIYGYRVRAGMVGDMFYFLDYCCGNQQDMVEAIFSVTKNILEQREVDKGLWDFPRQDLKPFYKNPKEFAEFTAMADEKTFEVKKIPNLSELRVEVINKMFSARNHE